METRTEALNRIKWRSKEIIREHWPWLNEDEIEKMATLLAEAYDRR